MLFTSPGRSPGKAFSLGPTDPTLFYVPSDARCLLYVNSASEIPEFPEALPSSIPWHWKATRSFCIVTSRPVDCSRYPSFHAKNCMPSGACRPECSPMGLHSEPIFMCPRRGHRGPQDRDRGAERRQGRKGGLTACRTSTLKVDIPRRWGPQRSKFSRRRGPQRTKLVLRSTPPPILQSQQR